MDLYLGDSMMMNYKKPSSQIVESERNFWKVWKAYKAGKVCLVDFDRIVE